MLVCERWFIVIDLFPLTASLSPSPWTYIPCSKYRGLRVDRRLVESWRESEFPALTKRCELTSPALVLCPGFSIWTNGCSRPHRSECCAHDLRKYWVPHARLRRKEQKIGLQSKFVRLIETICITSFLTILDQTRRYSNSLNTTWDAWKGPWLFKSGLVSCSSLKNCCSRRKISNYITSWLLGLYIFFLCWSQWLIYSTRCLGVLAEKIVQTTAMEDRKLRRELQVRLWIFSINSRWRLVGLLCETFRPLCGLRGTPYRPKFLDEKGR